MSLRKITQSVGEDIVDFVIGFPAVSTLSAIIQLALPALDFLRPNYFLDWKLEKWRDIYHKETPLCVYYQGKKILIPATLVFDNTDQTTSLQGVQFVLKQQTFRLRSDIRAKTEIVFSQYKRAMQLRGKRYANENNARISKIEGDEYKLTIHIECVRYEDYIRTNLSLDAKLSNNSESLREMVHKEGELDPLEDSLLGNNFGINVLLFTADGQIVLQKRSHRVLVRPNEIAPSASGTIAYTDVPNPSISLKSLPTLREAFEELGIEPDDVEPESVTFLGISREYIRGGQPDMFLCARTVLSNKDFHDRRALARDRYETKKLIFFDFGYLSFANLDSDMKRHQFLRKMDELIDYFEQQMSIPLWISLALWSKMRFSTGFWG